jgi:hypothetical protein
MTSMTSVLAHTYGEKFASFGIRTICLGPLQSSQTSRKSEKATRD